MKSLDNVYLEEASELINDLEDALLFLEKDNHDKTAIDKVFRVMHTLKGSSNMFGFEHIGHLTHDLENIYDKVRLHQLALTKEIYEITYKSVDHIRLLLADREVQNNQNRVNHEALLSGIKTVLNSNGNGKPGREEQYPTGKTGYATYYILFKPGKDLLKNGSNPLFVVDELVAMGEAKVMVHTEEVPSLNELDPASCYLYWEVLLYSGKEESVIHDVFIFVQDDSHIEIRKVSTDNLLEDQEFSGLIEKFIQSGKLIDLNVWEKRLVESKKGSQGPSIPNQENAPILKTEKNISSIRVASDKLDELMNLVSEMVTHQARLNLIAGHQNNQELITLSEEMDKVARQMRDNVFSICLIPINSIFMRFQRLVRDLSNELSKKVRLVTEGGETEIDKNIIEKIVDPIMHLLRNSIDHGIEDPGQRLLAGKDETGTITLKTFYSGSNVHIQIQDDGKGVNLEGIRKKAIEMGLIKQGSQLTEKETLNLLFHSGLSTAKKVTNVSGRGVGMDVVRQKINEIRGDVDISSEPGKGTTIVIKLPLTLSIIDGLLLNVSGEIYVIPLEYVQKIFVVKHDQLTRSFQQTVVLDGEQYPFVNLRNDFQLGENHPSEEQVVLINYENNKVGLAVDHVEGEYQAVLKPIGKLYQDQEYISGATILGDGSVALVLDPHKIVKQFTK